MRIDVVTLFPELFEIAVRNGVTGKALQRSVVELGLWNPRDYTTDKHRTVDHRPYGGGPGMVMMVQPLCDAIHAAKVAAPTSRTVYLSPQGRRLDQEAVVELASRPGLILVAGRYEGIDQRLIDSEIDEEWSIGDYVLSGGELAAMVVIDAVTRLLPGVCGAGFLRGGTAGSSPLHPAGRDRRHEGAGGVVRRRSCSHRPLAAEGGPGTHLVAAAGFAGAVEPQPGAAGIVARVYMRTRSIAKAFVSTSVGHYLG